MSVEAITWALRQETPSSTAKFILVALANCARAEDGLAWPSIAYLCEATQQDRKTVIANLGRLETALLIRRSGTAGRTKQINVYELALRPPPPTDTKSGTGTENGTVPDVPANSTVFPSKESQISASTVPKTGHGTVRNHKGTVIEPRAPSALVDDAAASTTRYRVPSCPRDEIVALYHQHLAALPAVEVLNGSRRRAIGARWREVCADGKFDRAAGLDWFDWFFARVAKSDFLMGRQPGRSGRTWAADFDFLLTPAKFARVVEGRYHQQGATP